MQIFALTDSPEGFTETPAKCRTCSATMRLGNGLCLSCTLREALDEDYEGSRESFEAALAKSDVKDAHWRVGNYEVLEEIGRGGMGVIYRAHQRHSRRIVALKRMVSYHADSRETRERFRREAEAAASLDYPNILPVYEVGQGEDGLPFFSMKYAAGGSLQKAGPALRADPRECVRLMAKVARAVQYAHEHGVVHRDLKPGNILRDARGEPFVTDFGLAKWLDAGTDLTRTLTIFGTPGYIAPEQARGSTAPTADVYSLGAILFNLFTGRPPFVGEHALVVIEQASEKPAPNLRSLMPSLDRDLETIVARCLERDPKGRYQSAGALTDDLERWLRHEPIGARRVSSTVRAWRWSKRNSKLAVATAAASLLAVAAILSFFWPRTPPLAVPGDKSVAVLPFENLGDKENEYIAEGMQDEILNDLARIAELKVISRTSVMGYRPDKVRNLRQIARTLRARYVLEGSVQNGGDQIRVRTRLIDSQSDTQVWAEQYEGAPTNVLSIESEIAKTVAERLQAKLSPSEKMKLEAEPTTNMKAFDLYLRGRYFWNKRSTQGLEQSIEYFNAAIQRDPRFALSYVGLAESYDLLIFYADRRPDLFFPKVEDAARMALQIDESLGQAHVPLARVEAYYRWNRDAALSEFRRALELNPNDETAHHLYGEYLIRIGLTSAGMKELSAALKLSPASIANNQDLGTAYYALHQYDRAIEQYHKTLQMDPNFAVCHAFLGMAYAAKGMHAEAIAETEKAIAQAGERPILMGMLGHTLVSGGRRDDASKILEKLISRSRQSYIAPLSMALIYVGLGQNDRALELLEKGYSEHDPWLVQFLRNYHQFDKLRADSRFAELMQRVGVASAQLNLDAKMSRSVSGGIAVLPFENLSADPENSF